MLSRLIRGLAAQRQNGFSYSLVVIDNDEQGGARQTVASKCEEAGLQFVYEVTRGNSIPVARNRAIDLAGGDLIAIIDDDEFPSPNWLANMLESLRLFEVDGCLGEVLPFFESTPPTWLLRSRFCNRPSLSTGTILAWNQTRTGNVLMRRAVFDSGLRFDERLSTGGTDREFFKQAMRKGFKFVAVSDAPVFEIVPPERWLKSYYIRRALVNGFNANKNAAEDMRGLGYIKTAAKCAAASLAYSAALPFAAIAGTHHAMSCLVRGGHHFSRLCGMAGIQLVAKRDF